MKKIGVLFLVLILFVLVACNKEVESTKREFQKGIPDCVTSNHTSDGDYDLTILANQDEIENKEEYARMLISKVIRNEFKTINFSFDEFGYPTRLQMSVYLSEEEWQDRDVGPFMKISFVQEDRIKNAFNILDNYDEFELEIE